MEGCGMKKIEVRMMSPAVMSRARNGHRVRLMKGMGTQLVVNENQFRINLFWMLDINIAVLFLRRKFIIINHAFFLT